MFVPSAVLAVFLIEEVYTSLPAQKLTNETALRLRDYILERFLCVRRGGISDREFDDLLAEMRESFAEIVTKPFNTSLYFANCARKRVRGVIREL